MWWLYRGTPAPVRAGWWLDDPPFSWIIRTVLRKYTSEMAANIVQHNAIYRELMGKQ